VIFLACAALLLALAPAALGAANLVVLRPPRSRSAGDLLVSILIPARDEALRIGAALAAARASQGVAIEILVMDDGSTDSTAGIVRRHADEDPRVRLLQAPVLPVGWIGKNHACQQLASAARGSHLLFLDADVELFPHAAAALSRHASERSLALVSGVPRQVMRSLGELMTVPAINFLLVGYLPIPRMRSTTDPALGAACGQLLLVDAAAYRAVGGHAAIQGCLHDALMLARHVRRAGLRTDLVAGAGLARCRMYDGLATAWPGFLKNAREGMANPIALPIWTLLLTGGHLLPWVLWATTGQLGWPIAIALALSLGLRLAVTVWARESLWSVPLHPLTIATALAIQWTALVLAQLGRPATWKGRAYHAG
jgi:glycosyltransferase involved in cell wall biosynthesis